MQYLCSLARAYGELKEIEKSGKSPMLRAFRAVGDRSGIVEN
jgi:hypothetical protein